MYQVGCDIMNAKPSQWVQAFRYGVVGMVCDVRKNAQGRTTELLIQWEREDLPKGGLVWLREAVLRDFVRTIAKGSEPWWTISATAKVPAHCLVSPDAR